MKTQADRRSCFPDVLHAGKIVANELLGCGDTVVGKELKGRWGVAGTITDEILEECQLALATQEEIELPAMQPYFMD